MKETYNDSMNQKESGQALLITILVLTIATTVALSLIGRGTVDQTISTQIEESNRAFNAAEAGIEESLQSGAGSGGQKILSPGVNYQVTRADIAASTGTYVLPQKSTVGITETVWLSAHTTTGDIDYTPNSWYSGNTINVCWSMEAPGNRPALVIAILYQDAGGVYVKRVAVDRDSATHNNQFQADDGISNGCGLTNYFQKTISLTTMGIDVSKQRLALRIRPEYADTQIAIQTQSGIALPKQGNRFESTGTTDSGVSRKVVVNQLYRAPSSIFDYVLYDQSGAILGH